MTEYSVGADDSAFFLQATLGNGDTVGLANPDQFAGHAEIGSTHCYLLVNNGLHIEIRTNPEHPVGKDAAANVADVVLEAAITTIQDCEDSVAAVDAEDKVARLSQLAAAS